VCDASGRPLEDLVVADTTQEHGIISHRGGSKIDTPRFPVGMQLRILPNHACATAAQHARYQVVNGSPVIEAVWERIAGW
jgi:D-serine deaminase-like pyridoxal phosphate-dependent protein